MLKFLSYKGRSVWKSFFFNENLRKNKEMLRNMVFTKKDINKTKIIHTGKQYFSIKVNEKMKGLKAGQSVLTKKIGSKIHKKKVKKAKKK